MDHIFITFFNIPVEYQEGIHGLTPGIQSVPSIQVHCGHHRSMAPMQDALFPVIREQTVDSLVFTLHCVVH